MDRITAEVLRIYEQMPEIKKRMMLAAIDILEDWPPTTPEAKFIASADFSDPDQAAKVFSILQHHVSVK